MVISMVNSPNQSGIQLTRQAILWRLILTGLLLMVLAGSSLTIFNGITPQPDTRVLPTLPYSADAGGQPLERGQE